MKLFYLSITALIVTCVACHSGSEQSKQNDSTVNTNIVADDDIIYPDSTELYFYKDITQQKSYSQIFVKDSVFVSQLIQQLKTKTVPPVNCDFNSKIYLYKKGEPYKTVYVAFKNDQCKYLCYVVAGSKKYFAVTPEIVGGMKSFEAAPQRVVETK